MRPAILPSLLCTALGLPLVGADPSSSVPVIWAEGVESPGICVERGNWYVTVIPPGIALDSLPAARLRTPRGESEGHILHLDPDQRLCLVEGDASLDASTPVALSPSAPPKAGTRASCLSGDSACHTTVVGKDWEYRGERFPLPFLRLRVSEDGSHCGAGTPLVGVDGHLIGILTGLELESNDEVYAIPAARVRKLVEDVKRHHRSGPVWVGLVFHDESSTPEVLGVKKASPAAEAGIKSGDVILAMGPQEIESFDDLVESIHNLCADEDVEVRVLRGLEERTLTMTPRFAEAATAASR